MENTIKYYLTQQYVHLNNNPSINSTLKRHDVRTHTIILLFSDSFAKNTFHFTG